MLRRALASILCVVAGWVTLVLYLLFRYYFLHLSVEGGLRSPDWFRMPVAIGIQSLTYIFRTWLLIVLPLFLFVSARSSLWRWPVSTAVFGLVGAVAMSAVFWFHVPSGFGRFVWFAALTGAATGLFSAVAQHRFRRDQVA